MNFEKWIPNLNYGSEDQIMLVQLKDKQISGCLKAQVLEISILKIGSNEPYIKLM